MEARGVRTRSSSGIAKPLQAPDFVAYLPDSGDESSFEEPSPIQDDFSDVFEDDIEWNVEGDDAANSIGAIVSEAPSPHPPLASELLEEAPEDEIPIYNPNDYKDWNDNVFESWKRKERARYTPPGPTDAEHVKIPNASGASRFTVPIVR